MQERGEVLVAIINQHRDFLLASEKQWYRIPVESQAKWLKERWPPRWLAFYQTKVFGNEAYSIRYFAKVKGIQEAYRWQLFPDEKDDPKATKHLGGIHEEDKLLPRKIDLNGPGGAYQLGLFDSVS